MPNDDHAVRIISGELETRVPAAGDRRKMAETTEAIALDIVKALYAGGFEIMARETR